MKKTLAFASMVLIATSLSACGDDSSDGGGGGTAAGDYCDQVQGAKDDSAELDFTTMSEDTFTGFQKSLTGIAAVAPADVKDDWATLGAALDALHQVLADAGLSFDDFQAISEDPSNLPEGVDLATLQGLATKISDAIDQAELADATAAIEAEVKTECDIDLSPAEPTETTPSS